MLSPLLFLILLVVPTLAINPARRATNGSTATSETSIPSTISRFDAIGSLTSSQNGPANATFTDNSTTASTTASTTTTSTTTVDIITTTETQNATSTSSSTSHSVTSVTSTSSNFTSSSFSTSRSSSSSHAVTNGPAKAQISTTRQTSTTSFFTLSSSTTLDDSAAKTNPVENTSATSNSGFWSNKSAVAGTFTVVALIVIALLAGLFAFIMKRRKRPSGYQEYYDKYPESLGPSPQNPPSPGPSSSDLHHTPMDPFSDRNVHYNTGPDDFDGLFYRPNPASVHHTNQLDAFFDPFSSPAPQIVPSITLTSVTPLSPSHPYAIARGKLAPVTLKSPDERDSYHPSIDSFYGGTESKAGLAQ